MFLIDWGIATARNSAYDVISAKRLYALYAAWCGRRANGGVPPVGISIFGRHLGALGIERTHSKNRAGYKVNSLARVRQNAVRQQQEHSLGKTKRRGKPYTFVASSAVDKFLQQLPKGSRARFIEDCVRERIEKPSRRGELLAFHGFLKTRLEKDDDEALVAGMLTRLLEEYLAD